MILIFAFVAGTLHAPAAAHTEVANHHADHGSAAIHDELADDSGDPASSHDGAADSVHHHCPTALNAPTSAISLGLMPGKALLPAHREAALTSFNQAPPTQPPST